MKTKFDDAKVPFLGRVPGLAPALEAEAISEIPTTGTGLLGLVYASKKKINSLDALDAVVEANDPLAVFTTSAINFFTKKRQTTLAEFVQGQGAIVDGDEFIEVGASGLVVMGYVFIPKGDHTITVHSGHGFGLRLGDVDIMDYCSRRNGEESSVEIYFDGGLYELELRAFGGGKKVTLGMEIDGFPVDQSAFYTDVEDLTHPPSDATVRAVSDYHPSHALGRPFRKNQAMDLLVTKQSPKMKVSQEVQSEYFSDEAGAREIDIAEPTTKASSSVRTGVTVGSLWDGSSAGSWVRRSIGSAGF